MAVSRVIEVSFGRSSVALVRIDTAYFYNNGILFKPTDLDLPASYQVHWADSPQASSTLETIGTAEGAPIPDDLWNRSRVIYGWIYLHPTEDSGITAYEVRIYKNVRAGLPDGTEPTPEEQSTIDQAISALNTAVAKTAQDVISADQSAQSAESAKTAAESARDTAGEYANDAESSAASASTSASQASTSATASAQSASQSAQIKADVEDLVDDAQSYANASAQSATASANSASDAQGYANTASVSAQSASTSASNASTSAQAASTKASEASTSASTASQKATEASQSASQALSYKTDAESAKTASQTAQGKAEDAQTAAETAQGLAESARDDAIQAKNDAESAVASISGALAEKAPVITDTASGSIASFSDGADDLPLKSLMIDINPVQDLHGQDAPYPAGGGKNLFQTTAQSKTENGVTWTVNADGTIAVSGTATGYTDLVAGYARVSSDMGVVTISGISTATNIAWGPLTVRDVNDNVLYTITTGGTTAVWSCDLSQYPEAYSIRVLVKRNNNAATSGAVKVQVEKGSTATAWTPYENICPISGWTQIGVNQSGVNVWDEEWESGDINVTTGEPRDNASRIRSKNFVPVRPNTVFYGKSSYPNTVVCFYGKDKEWVTPSGYAVAIDRTFTTPSWCYWIKLYCNTTAYAHDISINYPSTDHDYHPYTGRSITIPLGQTVYGGKLDVLSGELTVDNYAEYDGSEAWMASNAQDPQYFAVWNQPHSVSNSDATQLANWATHGGGAYQRYGAFRVQTNGAVVVGNLINQESGNYKFTNVADFKAFLSQNPLQIVYELAEPVEIQLTPNQVNSLLGVNNIWADSGDVEVEYRADTKLFIERLTAPDSADMIADANITSGKYFMVGNSLYKATANIANGSAIVVGTNCIRKSLSEALNEINA